MEDARQTGTLLTAAADRLRRQSHLISLVISGLLGLLISASMATGCSTTEKERNHPVTPHRDQWLAKEFYEWFDQHKHYPEELKRKGIQGKVLISLLMTQEGMRDVKVEKSSGHPELDKQAIADLMNAPLFVPSRPLEKDKVPMRLVVYYKVDSDAARP